MSKSFFRSTCALLPLLLVAAPALAQQPEEGEGDAKEEPEDQPVPISPDAPDSPDVPTEIDDDVLDQVTKTPGGKLTIDLLAVELRPQPGGLTPDDVADRAMTKNPQVRIKKAELREAAARVDQAYAAYVPTVTAMASYTRLSRVVNDIGVDVPGIDTTFPVIVNQYQLSASLEVPLSDYLLRTTQAFSAVSLEVETKKLEIRAQELQARANAKIAFFNWLRARGQRVMARLSVALSERHLKDAKVGLAAGILSEADVARLEAQRAQSAHLARMTANLEKVAEEQLRTVMRLPAKTKLSNGVNVLGEPRKIRTSLVVLKRQALRQRMDRKALAKASTAFEKLETVTRASHYPRLAAFANALYANPNPRVFPQKNEWDFTWDVGLRLTWRINDTFTTVGSAREINAQRIAVEENKRALEDAIRMSVTSAYYEVQTANSAIQAAKQRERAAAINLDARRKLFRGGKATATEIVDAEAELTEARLQRLDAQIDHLVAIAKLELAVGGPVK
jgi:outer membrane protein TolC